MVISDCSHLKVYASEMLFGPASILVCLHSILVCCLPYLSRYTSCTCRWCHLWSPVTSVIFRSHFFAALSCSSQYSGRSLLLVVVIPSNPLRFPFSLYDSLWALISVDTLMGQRVLLIFRAMPTAAPDLCYAALAALGNSICLWLSVSFFVQVGYPGTFDRF